MDIPRPYALNPCDLGRLLLIGRPDQMAPEGSGGRKDSLKFEARDNIGRSLVAIDIVGDRIEDLASRSNDDRTRSNG